MEGVATLSQILAQVLPSKIETEDGVGERVGGDSVGDTITRVQDDAVVWHEGQDGQNSDVESGGTEGVKHDLGHLFAVGLGIEVALVNRAGGSSGTIWSLL